MRRLLIASLLLGGCSGRSSPPRAEPPPDEEATPSGEPARAASGTVRHVATDGSFTIDFPRRPTVEVVPLPGGVGPGQAELANMVDERASFGLAASSYVLPQVAGRPEEVLAGIARFAGGGPTHLAVVEQHAIEYAHRPGLALRLEGSYPGKGRFSQAARFIFDPATARVFSLSVSAQGSVDDAVAARFFESLQIR